MSATINDLELNAHLMKAKEELAFASKAVMHGKNETAFIHLMVTEKRVNLALCRLNDLKFKEKK